MAVIAKAYDGLIDVTAAIGMPVANPQPEGVLA